jgi:hypothetical protein
MAKSPKKSSERGLEASGNLDLQRAQALDRAFIMSRLLDQRYFPAVSEAIKKGREGEPLFKEVCEKAGIPHEMIIPIWKILLLIEKNRTIALAVDW